MSRQVWILSGLLAFALVLSYLSANRRTTASAGDRIEVISVTPEEVERVRYTTEKGTTELLTRKDALGTWYEVTIREPSKEAAAPKEKDEATGEVSEKEASEKEASGKEGSEKASEEATKEAAPPPKVKRFTATGAGERVLRKLAPLHAYRVLEDLDPERLATLGLAESKDRLEIVRKGRTFVFDVGARTYGAARRYLRQADTGRVYLIDGSPLRTLENAERTLVERKLLGLRRSEIERARIERGEQTVTMVQQNRDDRTKAYWSTEADPEKKVETWRNWIDKFFGLQARKYVDMDPEALEEVFRIAFEGDGRTETVRVFRERPTASDENEEAHYYARSDNTRAVVKIDDRLAGEVVADLDGVFQPPS